MLHVLPESNEFKGEIIPCNDLRLGTSQPFGYVTRLLTPHRDSRCLGLCRVKWWRVVGRWERWRRQEKTWEKGCSGTSLQATKAALVGTTPAGSTQIKGGTDCIHVRLPRSYYRVLDDQERHSSDASLLHKPRITGPQTKLYPNGKASSITGFCSQEVAKKCRTKVHQTLRWCKLRKSHGHSSRMDRHFTALNNEVEYEALIAGLRIAAQMGVCNVHSTWRLYGKCYCTGKVQELSWDDRATIVGMDGKVCLRFVRAGCGFGEVTQMVPVVLCLVHLVLV
nr:hypothetical protein [Tanacetum cinerariifolium]